MILVHGLIGPLRDERALSRPGLPGWAAPDLLGYGSLAGADPARITVDAQVAQVHAAAVRAAAGGRVHLVGHSVGGMLAAVFAHRFPDLVASVVSVEGNFSLADAFWSARIAEMPPEEVEALVAADRADPTGWLREAGAEPSPENVRAAEEALGYQPATTVRATARAVVGFTGRDAYPALLREVFDRVPVHLVAGERSRSGWDVPGWALDAAASYTEIAGAGHMVMLERPEAFGDLLATLVGDGPGSGSAEPGVDQVGDGR